MPDINNPWAGVFLYKNGVLFWTTGRNFGRIAGSYNSAGIHIIKYQNQQYTTARIIYEMHHGQLEIGQQIGYIDGNKENRKIENLVIIEKTNKIQQARETKLANYKNKLEQIKQAKLALDMNDELFYETFTKLHREDKRLTALIIKMENTNKPNDSEPDAIESLIPTNKVTSDFIQQGAAMLDAMFKAAE